MRRKRLATDEGMIHTCLSVSLATARLIPL